MVPVSGRRPPIEACNIASSSHLEITGSAASARALAARRVNSLQERTRRETVTFEASFYVEGTEAEHPAGIYTVETQDERIEGLSFLAYRRVSTSIFLPLPGSGRESYQLARIDPKVVRSARVNPWLADPSLEDSSEDCPRTQPTAEHVSLHLRANHNGCPNRLGSTGDAERVN